MTPEDVQRRADAIHRWTREHPGAADTECPVCSGVKWVWRLEHAGAFMPRACSCCGHVKWFDAKRLGLEPAPAPAEQGRADEGGPTGKDG
jgi:hypothetical protein